MGETLLELFTKLLDVATQPHGRLGPTPPEPEVMERMQRVARGLLANGQAQPTMVKNWLATIAASPAAALTSLNADKGARDTYQLLLAWLHGLEQPPPGMGPSTAGNALTIQQEAMLDTMFTYHPPHGDQPARYQALREAGRAMAEVLLRCTPVGLDQAAALEHVRAAVMFGNAAIALEGK